MEREIIAKRRLVIILVLVTVVIFIGLVWLIASSRPWNLLGLQPSTGTAGLQAARDCTMPVAYWKAHPELFPSQVYIGGVAYGEIELEALFSDDSEDLAQQIRAQLAAAFLNSQAGAGQTAIQATLFAAYGWLEQHPAGSQLSGEERLQGEQMYDELERYNLGLGEVEACEANLVATRTARPSWTATIEISPSPSPTSTATPSETPTPTQPTATATYNYLFPTRTTTRTSGPPAENPTNTPRPPTQPPAATNTPRPPDTATYTPPPPPTATFTLPPLPTATFTLPPPP
jgi:hypothetical protein